MKKASCLFAVLSIVFSINSTNLQAQDPNCGIVIDGVRADTITCWSFEKLDAVFPVDKTKWKKYDRISIGVHWEKTIKIAQTEEFSIEIFPQQIDDYFADDVKYGVFHFLKDKSEKEFQGNSGHWYTKKDLANQMGIRGGNSAWVEIYGETLNGSFHYTNSGTKVLEYNQLSIFKSSVTTINKAKYSTSGTCIVPGTKFEFKMEPADANSEIFGVIRGSLISIPSAPTKATSVPVTTTSTSSPTFSSVTEAGKLPVFDKKKTGYFEEKSSSGKIIKQGYKINDKLEGECRSYGENDKSVYIYHYVNDAKEGYAAIYAYDGTLKSEGYYKNDLMEGEWKNYKKGVLTETEMYKEGNPVE